MVEIELSRGYKSKIDDEDYELVTRYKWHANPKTFKNGKVYVRAAARIWHKEEKRYYNWTLANWIMQPSKGLVVDHINRDPLDNRRRNLRICTQSENIFNKESSNLNRTSKYRGVHFDKSRAHRKKHWMANLNHEGKSYRIGRFETEVEAAKAYNKLAKELYNSPWILNNIIDN